MFVSNGLVEQHIHGAFGYDFMNCSVDDILTVSELLSSCGVTAFFPTIMTDSLDVIKERIQIVKQAMQKQKKKAAQIIGVHLEGPFINLDKLGIHEKKHVLPLKIDLFKQIEDDVIKMVTLAPELDIESDFVDYLKSKGIKISVGHSVATDLSKADQVTHLYNAMGTFSHREKSTVISALTDDNINVEIIADSMHVSDEVLKITFKQKSIEKILLISDALPLAHSDIEQQKFAGGTIYNRNGKLTNIDGVLAGSSMLLCDIIKNLADKNLLKIEDATICASSNQLKYHNISSNLKVYWTDSNTIDKIEFI
ncbi:MAG: hypothetical protein IJY61_06325 [Candidatus Gastranaerophilales bacterium]|nr:hypothetical protein [Candidatus Gastranaerophilales bacterium]